MKQASAYPLRLDETLQKKVKKIAKDNDRTFRAQIENILKNFVAEYERVHGEIILDSDQND
jgi:hypothetical protein